MNEKEIREHFAAHPVENQVEFEAWMAEINAVQASYVNPLDRHIGQINQRHANIMTQKRALNIQLDQLKQERVDVEQRRRDICAVFHELKHAMIQLNPREKFVKEQNADPRPDTEEELLEGLKAKRNALMKQMMEFKDAHCAASSADLSQQDRREYEELWDEYAKTILLMRDYYRRLPRIINGQPTK